MGVIKNLFVEVYSKTRKVETKKDSIIIKKASLFNSQIIDNEFGEIGRGSGIFELKKINNPPEIDYEYSVIFVSQIDPNKVDIKTLRDVIVSTNRDLILYLNSKFRDLKDDLLFDPHDFKLGFIKERGKPLEFSQINSSEKILQELHSKITFNDSVEGQKEYIKERFKEKNVKYLLSNEDDDMINICYNIPENFIKENELNKYDLGITSAIISKLNELKLNELL